MRRENSLEDLLAAGREAFNSGDRNAAHELWRMAAVANPYDERVWAALLEVLTSDDDREVCLENIIAINPLNPDARRQLRAIKRTQRYAEENAPSAAELESTSRRQLRAERRAERLKAEAEAADEPFIPPTRSLQGVRSIAPTSIDELLADVEKTHQRRSVFRSVLRGIAFGLVAVLVGVIFSVVVYGGMLPR
jgi:hypothetical protein